MNLMRLRLDVLRELRVPTKTMVAAGCDVKMWQAMIDIAIAETEAELAHIRQDFTATPPPAVIGVRGH